MDEQMEDDIPPPPLPPDGPPQMEVHFMDDVPMGDADDPAAIDAAAAEAAAVHDADDDMDFGGYVINRPVGLANAPPPAGQRYAPPPEFQFQRAVVVPANGSTGKHKRLAVSFSSESFGEGPSGLQSGSVAGGSNAPPQYHFQHFDPMLFGFRPRGPVDVEDPNEDDGGEVDDDGEQVDDDGWGLYEDGEQVDDDGGQVDDEVGEPPEDAASDGDDESVQSVHDNDEPAGDEPDEAPVDVPIVGRATRSRPSGLPIVPAPAPVPLPVRVPRNNHNSGPAPGYNIELDSPTLDPNLNIFQNKMDFLRNSAYYPKKGKDYPITKIVGWDADFIQQVCLYGMSWEPIGNCGGCREQIGEFRMRCIDPTIPLKLPTYAQLLNYASQADKFSRNGVLAVLGQQVIDKRIYLLVVWSAAFSYAEKELRARKDPRTFVPRRDNPSEQDNLVRDFRRLQRDYVDEYQRSTVRREMNYQMHFQQLEYTHADDWPMTLLDVAMDNRLNLSVLYRMLQLPPLYSEDSIQWLFHFYDKFRVIRPKDMNPMNMPGTSSMNTTPVLAQFSKVWVFWNNVTWPVTYNDCVVGTINQKKVVAFHRRKDNRAIWFSAQYLVHKSKGRRRLLPPRIYLVEVNHCKTPIPAHFVLTLDEKALPMAALQACDEAMNGIQLRIPIKEEMIVDSTEMDDKFPVCEVVADVIHVNKRKYY